jgi:hypothetical protein
MVALNYSLRRTPQGLGRGMVIEGISYVRVSATTSAPRSGSADSTR